jgi:hypothetical protein
MYVAFSRAELVFPGFAYHVSPLAEARANPLLDAHCRTLTPVRRINRHGH